MRKKGIELSVNFFVIIILGLIVFGIGFAIFKDVFQKGWDIYEDVDRQTEQRIISMLNDDGALVAVPYLTKTVERGDLGKYALGIRNEFEESKDFRFEVTKMGEVAIEPLYISDAVSIGPNSYKSFQIGLEVDKGVPKGQYGFTIKVFANNENYGPEQRIYVVVP
jgi:hypothetical protein